MKQILLTLLMLLVPSLPLHAADPPGPFAAFNHDYVLIGLGDSLTQGTMDATINSITTPKAFLQKVHESLAQVQDIELVQPLLTWPESAWRPSPFRQILPSAALTSSALRGLPMANGRGSGHNRSSSGCLCNGLLPGNFQDIYDKTLYPYNLLQGGPASQIDSAIWLLNFMHRRHAGRAVCILWIGVNDAANAALASGYNLSNPAYIALPFPLIENVLTPGAAALLRLGQGIGAVSFEPYTLAAIERNLTDPVDFAAQYEHVLARIEGGAAGLYETTDLFVCTLYDIWAAYLLDSNDLEFYLCKLDPQYTVPSTFARAAATGAPATDAPRGDRIGLLTFLCMYTLLSTGADSQTVNQILEVDGVQNDGLVVIGRRAGTPPRTRCTVQ